MQLPEELSAIAQQQRGLLTRRQLRDGGVTRAAVRWAVGRTWRIVLPGVVATFTGELDAGQKLVAGCLWAGDASQLASLTALRWHGRTEIEDDGVVRLVVAGTDSRREGFALRRRTSRLDPRPWTRGPLTICSRARALVDASRELRTTEAARSLLVSSVQQGFVRLEDLRAELEAGAVRGSAAVRAAMAAADTGGWSSPEVDVLAELARSDLLPRVWPNPVLHAADGTRLPSPDFWLDDVGLAGQVHSRAFHLRDEQWEVTVATDTVFGEYGVPVIAVTPSGFRRDPSAFRRRVERAHAQLRVTGRRPDVLMTPRAAGVLA